MPATKRTATAPKKASGKNIEDWQRKTERITLRLKPDVMRMLESLSTETGSYAKTIEQALHALDREMDAESVGE